MKVKVEGNCCWEVSVGQFGRGQSMQVGGGFNGPVDFTIRSLKKVPCVNE